MISALVSLWLVIPAVSLARSESLRIGRAVAMSWESGVRLDGSRMSYAQFSTWSVCRNASLSFQFQTRYPTALLVYADDGQRFVEVRLIRGALRLRYRLSSISGHVPLTTAGEGLDDGLWHAVRLWSPDGVRLFMSVDGASNSPAPQVTVRPGAATTVRLARGLFVGGLPASVRRRPMDLAVPAVAFERRLDGSVRSFHSSRCTATSTGGSVRRAVLEAGRGMTPADRRLDDRCKTDSPCLHGGICVNAASGPLCECDRTDYDGMTCSIGLSRFTPLLSVTVN